MKHVPSRREQHLADARVLATVVDERLESAHNMRPTQLPPLYGGRLEDALCQSDNFCYGEEAVIAASIAEAAGTGSGIAYAIARDRPDLLGLVIDNLVNHRSFYVPAKLSLLGVLPWGPGVSAVTNDAYAWVTHLGTTVLTLRGTLDGKKAWASFATP